MKAILERCFECTNCVKGKCELDLTCLYEIIASYSLVSLDIAFSLQVNVAK